MINCPICNGAGRFNGKDCGYCGGFGLVPDSCVVNGVIQAPPWLKRRMDAVRKRPPPSAEAVERQFRAVEQHRAIEELKERIQNADAPRSDQAE